MDVQGSHPSTHTLSLADSQPENRWGLWHGTPPPLRSVCRCEDSNVAGVVSFNLCGGAIDDATCRSGYPCYHALPLPCISPLVGAHLPLTSMELWFCLNVLDVDSGLQVVLLLSGEVCSIL